MSTLTVKKILCPFDFTRFCREGLEMAVTIARQFDAELHVLHVVVTPPSYVVAQGSYVPGILEDQHRVESRIAKEREPEIEAEVQALGGGDLRHKVVVMEGVREDLVIREYAETIGADLIVMASHGRRGLVRFFLGSTTERVLKGAPCPVLIVRPREARERDRLTDQRQTACADESRSGEG